MSEAYLRHKKADGAESMLYTVLWLHQIIPWQIHQHALHTQLSHCIIQAPDHTMADTSTCTTHTTVTLYHTVNSRLIIQQFYTWQMLPCNIPQIIESKCEVITNLIVAQLFQWCIITFHCHHCMLTDIFSSISHIPKSWQNKQSHSRMDGNAGDQFNLWNSCHDRTYAATCLLRDYVEQ